MNTRKTHLALLPLLLMLLAPFTLMAQDDTSTEEAVTYTVLTDCSDTGYDENQLPQNLFDGDMTTKWHLNNFTKRGSLVVTFQASKPINVCGYQISTCEDAANINLARSPKTWKLYGRNDRPTTKEGTDGWTLIDEVTDDDKLTGDSKMTAEYTCKTTQKYEYFKWVVTAVRNASKSDCLQASEFTLISPQAYIEIASNTMYFRYNKKTANEGSTYYDITDSPTWNSDLDSKRVKKVVFDEDFQYYKPTTCRSWFQKALWLETIEGMKYLDTSEVTDMSSMFRKCWIKVLDLSALNTAQVTNMSNMFSDCESLEELILPATFTTDNVTNMYQMFWCCYSLKNIDLSTFNTSRVTNMEGMFYYCEGLTELNFPATFTAENVTNMKQMFGSCKSLKTLDLSTFNTSRVTNMMYMFRYCTGFTELAFPATFSTESVTNMQQMFEGCTSLKVLDLTYFNTPQLDDIAWMFRSCKNLVTIFASDKFTTSRVSYGPEVFIGCSKLKSYITYNESNVSFKYANCTQNGYFTDKNKLGAYVRQTDNTLTFYNGYYKLDSDWELNTGTDTPGWNDAAEEITTVVFDPSFKDLAPTSCYKWFNGFVELNTIEGIENLNTADVTDMSYMFNGCGQLTTLDLSGFNTQNLQKMERTFYNCNYLETIYVSDKFTKPSTTSDKTFHLATKLVGAITYDKTKTTSSYANYTNGYFTKKVGENGGEIIGAAGSPLKAESLAVDDNKALTLYEDFTVGTATYSRTVSSDWGTLCLPIAVDLDGTTGFKAYQLISNNDETVELEELSGTLAAGTPVIIKMDEGNTTLSITTTNNTTAATEKVGKSTTDGTLHMLGTYTQKMFTADDANCYIVKNNMLMNTAKILETGKVSTVGIKPFRAYLIASSASIDAPRMEYTMVINGGTTAIDTVTSDGNATNQPAEYYDLQGRRISQLQKGINIVKRGNKTVKVLVR